MVEILQTPAAESNDEKDLWIRQQYWAEQRTAASTLPH